MRSFPLSGLLLSLAIAGVASASVEERSDRGHGRTPGLPIGQPAVLAPPAGAAAVSAPVEAAVPLGEPQDRTASTTLYFDGDVAYTFSGSTAVLTADYVRNTSTTYTTGTLRMSLWMSQGNYRQSGYYTAQYTLGSLSPNHYFYDISSGTIAFSLPPTGCYYVSMLLEEYQGNSTWYYVDYIDFSNKVSVNNGCGSSSCSYSISPSSGSFGSSGGSGSFAVAGSPSGCSGSWSATSNNSWISVTSGSSGTGSGNWTTYFSVASNSSSSSRTGSISAGGYTYTVTQSGASSACSDAPSSGIICLRDGRFKVTGQWLGFDDDTWRPIVWSRETQEVALGTFQNNPNDVTVITKMVWGCPYNNNYWFWLGGFTDAGYQIVVTDTTTSASQTYNRSRQSGVFPTTVRDATHFPCP